MKSKVLIVDDEKDICFLISEILKDEEYLTKTAINSNDALNIYKSFKPDLIILDVWLGKSDLDGIELLKEFKKLDQSIPIIIISGHGTVDMAVNAIKNGAYDFLEKPFNSEKMIVLSKRAIENARLLNENKILKKIAEPEAPIIGNSNFISDLKKNLQKISDSTSRILIYGQVGTGKKLIANTIHKLSKRNNYLANVIDFSNLKEGDYKKLFNEDLNEINNNIFFKSNNGTLILQNIEFIPLEYQKIILKYLENEKFFSNFQSKLNIKIISITSKDLNNEIKIGNFRKDLFYRLNVIPINVPSIKKRREDIMPICNHYLKLFNNKKIYFSKLAISKLESYDWPGNVRQIINYIEKTAILNVSEKIKNSELNNLPNDMGEFKSPSSIDDNFSLSLKKAREKFEREYLLSQIKRFNGNISKISDFTGMERTALYRKFKSLNIILEKK